MKQFILMAFCAISVLGTAAQIPIPRPKKVPPITRLIYYEIAANRYSFYPELNMNIKATLTIQPYNGLTMNWTSAKPISRIETKIGNEIQTTGYREPEETSGFFYLDSPSYKKFEFNESGITFRFYAKEKPDHPCWVTMVRRIKR